MHNIFYSTLIIIVAIYKSTFTCIIYLYAYIITLTFPGEHSKVQLYVKRFLFKYPETSAAAIFYCIDRNKHTR